MKKRYLYLALVLLFSQVLKANAQQFVTNQNQCLKSIACGLDSQISIQMSKCVFYKQHNMLADFVQAEIDLTLNLMQVAGVLDQVYLTKFCQGALTDLVSYCNTHPESNNFYNPSYILYGVLADHLDVENPIWWYAEGLLSVSQSNYPRATDYFKQASELAKKNKNFHNHAILTSMGAWLGGIKYDRQNYINAVEDYKRDPYERHIMPLAPGQQMVKEIIKPKPVPQAPVVLDPPFSPSQLPKSDPYADPHYNP